MVHVVMLKSVYDSTSSQLQLSRFKCSTKVAFDIKKFHYLVSSSSDCSTMRHTKRLLLYYISEGGYIKVSHNLKEMVLFSTGLVQLH